MKTVLLLLIRIYRRYISPMKPSCCRYYPTCSTYALQAVTEHGALRGGFLALVRVLRCNPLFKGGYDPVPERKTKGENPCCGGHGHGTDRADLNAAV